jgi:hypothetical protein
MPAEDAVLEELMGHLGEASRRIRAARRLLLEHALIDEPRYLRLAARLSEALDATETASREARRGRDASQHRTSGVGGCWKFRIGPGLSVYRYPVSCHHGE